MTMLTLVVLLLSILCEEIDYDNTREVMQGSSIRKVGRDRVPDKFGDDGYWLLG